MNLSSNLPAVNRSTTANPPKPSWPHVTRRGGFTRSLNLLLLGFLLGWAVEANGDPWKVIDLDLEYLEHSPGAIQILSGKVFAVRSSLEYYTPVVHTKDVSGSFQKYSTKTVCESTGADACINANFFDEKGKPLGLVVSRSIQRNPIHQGGKTLTGLFVFSREGIQILSRDATLRNAPIEAFQSGPRLITQARPVKGLRDKGKSTNRSILCIDAKERLILVAVKAGFLGPTLEKLQELLVRPPFSCVEALNLDGGGSTQFYVNTTPNSAENGEVMIELKGSEDVPSVLALRRKNRDRENF